MYDIYQLPNAEDGRNYLFMPYAFVESFNINVNVKDYNKVYSENKNLSLDEIFSKFNLDRPDDFKGHSLSVSDVIVLHENNEQKAYYIDTIGFAELPDFFDEIDGRGRNGVEVGELYEPDSDSDDFEI